jgi:DNA-binding XRE family transcriptional regulator
MTRVWSAEQKAKQSKRAARAWQKRIAADPTASPVAKARAARDLTQRELSELAGCAPQTISEVENGKRVSHYVRDRICRALATPDSELFPT